MPGLLLACVDIGTDDDAYTDDVWKEFMKHMFDPKNTRKVFMLESKQLASDGKHGLLYIDDQAYALKNKRIEQLLRLIYFNSRHMHLSSIIISQTLRQVGVNIRKTASHLLTYEPAEKKLVRGKKSAALQKLGHAGRNAMAITTLAR